MKQGQDIDKPADLALRVAAAIGAATSPDELYTALIGTLDQSKVDQLTERLAQAGFAIRVAEEGGVE